MVSVSDHRDDAKRKFHKKDHPPIKVIADPAAEHRPGAARGGEGDGEIGVVLGAILGRGDVAEDHLRVAVKPPPPQPCTTRPPISISMLVDDAASSEPCYVDAERDQERRATAMDVGEFAVKRSERGRRDQDRR